VRVLVTGATGFVGSHVLRELAAGDAEIRVLALPDTVAEVPEPGRVDILPGSLAEELPRGVVEGADVVYHLAWQLRPGGASARAVNVDGTRALLEACAAAGVRRVAFTSTAAVYDTDRRRREPLDEDAPVRARGGWLPAGVREPAVGAEGYVTGKLAAEEAVRSVGDSVETVILRPASAYGPSSEWLLRLVKALLDRPGLAAVARRPVQWVHVRDLVAGIVAAGTAPEAAGGVFNLAGPSTVTPAQLRRLVIEVLGGSAEGSAEPPLPPLYDLTRAERVLGYRPATTLHAGLRELLAPATAGAGSARG
jgi:nucleoside-diphosphate-sugar epimerase